MKRRRSSPARAAMKLLCTLLGLILVVMLGATVYFQHLLSQISNTRPDNSSTLLQDSSDALMTFAEELGDTVFSEHDTQIGGRGSRIINILLVGQDRRENESRARSDSMILCTINKDTRQLTMTSFLRDLYVQIPGYANNRINAAYSFGGMPLLEETLETNFGLHIDGSVEVDFSQFSGIIDLLGGVEIELRQDEANVINQETGSTLSQGAQRLTGDQALAYARIRSLDSDGDFSRTNRQRKVMSALLETYKSSSLTTMLTLLDDILPMISTDMSNGKILTLALELFPLLSGAQIVSQHVPAAGTYTDKTVDGMSVLVADMETVRQTLSETLLGE